ncbi:unnamed protein product [Cuscuta europaea]|uniref:Uncharacterized protein n=1 Tax=Cuscuta europaea TaxID=41803 RepID=A0A9P0ZLY4_CUSEU|nr:unnamed protein product [Cuscuta europaea]
MGFGGLLSLKIQEIPSKLAFWVLKSFNAADSTMYLGKNNKLHVNEANVAHVMGFPRGQQLIVKKKKSENCQLILERAALFEGQTNRIKPTQVCDKMLKCTSGGPWFKRHFIVLMVSLLLDNTANGYANPLILSNLVNVVRIREMNWCEYVMTTLIEKKHVWEKNDTKSFTGPLLFLMLLYVDRVVVYRRKIDRSIPAWRGWTSTLLRARETEEMQVGGIGLGYIDGPYEQPKILEESGNKGEEQFAEKENEINKSEREQPKGEGKSEDFMEEFALKTNLLATTSIEIINMVQQAPEAVMGNESFKKMQEAARSILGLTGELSPEKMTSDAGSQREMPWDDAFWSNENNILALIKAENALVERAEYKKNKCASKFQSRHDTRNK